MEVLHYGMAGMGGDPGKRVVCIDECPWSDCIMPLLQ